MYRCDLEALLRIVSKIIYFEILNPINLNSISQKSNLEDMLKNWKGKINIFGIDLHHLQYLNSMILFHQNQYYLKKTLANLYYSDLCYFH